jgi:L-aminopeptidase/D-esterase-like protein
LREFRAPQHTTIGVIATSFRLTKPEAKKVAQLGLLGFARALSPPHTAVDGDALFCLSTGEALGDLTAVGLVAADVVARAIVGAIKAAASLPGLPAWRDRGS